MTLCGFNRSMTTETHLSWWVLSNNWPKVWVLNQSCMLVKLCRFLLIEFFNLSHKKVANGAAEFGMVAVKSEYTWRCRTVGAFKGLEGSEMRQVLINHSAGGRRWGLFCISSVCFFLGFLFSWQEVPRAHQQLKEELHSFSRDSSIPPFVPRQCLFERPSSP